MQIPRLYEGFCVKALFLAIQHANCDKIAIGNPIPSKIFEYPPCSQSMQPYMFGHPYTKKTLLWLKGLEPLKQKKHGVQAVAIPTNMEKNTNECLQKIGRRIQTRPLKGWQKQWRSSGVKARKIPCFFHFGKTIKVVGEI